MHQIEGPRRWLLIGWLMVPLAWLSSQAGYGQADGSKDERHPAVRVSGLKGFHEAVLSVADLETWIDTLRQVAGWEVIWRGTLSEETAAYWEFGSSGPVEAAVLRNPGTDRGFLRLLRLPKADRPIRSAAQSWDTGGLFDLNLRAADVVASYRAFEDRGWSAYSPPVSFTFGPFSVREVLMRGPDGVVLAMIERLAPPLEGWPHLRRLSRIFNATQVVADFDAARAFYVETLGFLPYLEHVGPSRKAGPNVLGLPHDLAARAPRRVAILSPDGGNDGSVEILAFDGVAGADLSSQVSPRARGILALRFPVTDLDSYLSYLASRQVEPAAGPAEVEVAPYGTVRLATLNGPEGIILQLMEKGK